MSQTPGNPLVNPLIARIYSCSAPPNVNMAKQVLTHPPFHWLINHTGWLMVCVSSWWMIIIHNISTIFNNSIASKQIINQHTFTEHSSLGRKGKHDTCRNYSKTHCLIHLGCGRNLWIQNWLQDHNCFICVQSLYPTNSSICKKHAQ